MRTLDLGGTWKARWTDGVRGRMQGAENKETDPDRYIDAQVPGEIHLDCLRAGLIRDPYVEGNCLAARWIEEMIWSYRREFDSPPEALKVRAWLLFEGLDLAATIVLNGKEIGRHCNYFYPCRIEVTGLLREKQNILTVHLDSGLYWAADKPAQGYNNSFGHFLHKRHWLRKPQCQFGWDWSTRLINVGIHRPVRLEWTKEGVRIDQFVPLAECRPDLSSGRLEGRLFVEGLTDKTVHGVVRVTMAGIEAEAAVEIRPGHNRLSLCLDVPDPKLWWPIGCGEQNLYEVRAVLRIGEKVIGERTARVGFRHVRVVQDAHPISGRYFHLEVNGRKVFARGANFVPADMIFARLDRARYERLTDLALEANFNMLRVWGGGLYESDDFYELCNEKGILVWQEFVFACSKYPAQDETFHEDVKREARYNIRRLAVHPSLVIWCGNNEIEQGDWHWGYDRGAVIPDHALFHITLPRMLAEEDPTRYYQPSSPYSPEGMDPCRDDIGDQHPWAIGFANIDFREYRNMICRFPNEGGVLGPTALPTMLACLPEGQRRVGSFAWQTHDNSVDTWDEPSYAHRITSYWLGREARDLSIEEMAYWGGLIQGEALREYCDNFRRRMFDSGSAIFWMYNDCWPATRSWTIVDYFLRRTPSFHPVRRAMAPVSVVLACEGDEVIVFGVNDTMKTIEAGLRYGVFRMAGGYDKDCRADVVLVPNSSTLLARFPMSEWTDASGSAAFAMLEAAGELLARNRLFLPLFKELNWVPARVRVRLENGRAIFESSTFAWGVCLDLEGERRMPDNFFDIYPDVPYSIPWESDRPPVILWSGNLAGQS